MSINYLQFVLTHFARELVFSFVVQSLNSFSQTVWVKESITLTNGNALIVDNFPWTSVTLLTEFISKFQRGER